ncbi:MAG: hypothetical protein WBI21_07940 [Natronincolaceae bacterium]
MKIYFAAIEDRTEQIIKAGGIDYGLTSFYYLRGKNVSRVKELKNVVNKSWLIDSGAFTFMNSGGEVNWNKYVDDYADFINKYDIELFIELDLYSVIGVKNTEKLRKRLELKTGKKCIPVFHPELGIDYYKKMVDAYDYIAIGGIVVGKWKNESQMIPLINYANQKGVKVHGLGFTRISKLDRFNFYSVDSTSWKSDRFGQIYTFNGRSLKQTTNNNKRKKLDWKRAAFYNIVQWKKYAKYMEEK